jgi:CHASE3 domain sensor protein
MMNIKIRLKQLLGAIAVILTVIVTVFVSYWLHQ